MRQVEAHAVRNNSNNYNSNNWQQQSKTLSSARLNHNKIDYNRTWINLSMVLISFSLYKCSLCFTDTGGEESHVSGRTINRVDSGLYGGNVPHQCTETTTPKTNGPPSRSDKVSVYINHTYYYSPIPSNDAQHLVLFYRCIRTEISSFILHRCVCIAYIRIGLNNQL
jgi:hypothetical protein